MTTRPLAFVKSSLLRLATLSAFLSVLLMKAGELSPAIAFCSSSVLARISSGLRPLAASSRCIAARIYRHKNIKKILDVDSKCVQKYLQ